MSAGNAALTIALIGHYGAGNIGDEATIEAAVRAIRARLQDVRIVGVSANPGDTEQRHGISSYPVRRYYARRQAVSASQSESTIAARRCDVSTGLRAALKRWPLARPAASALRGVVRFVLSTIPGEIAFTVRTYRFLRRVDLALIAGSGQFNDEWFGPWAFPYTLARWAVLARLAGARLAIVSVGAGPIGSPLSGLFYRLCLSLAEYRSFRDEFSLELARRIGFRGDCRVYPDLAHGLGGPRPTDDARSMNARRPTVAINAMPVMDARYWHSADPKLAERYRDALTSAARTLRAEGWNVFFYPSQPKDMEVIEDIIAALGAGPAERSELVRYVDTVDGALNVVKSADVVVATRFHGAVLAMAVGTPAIAISYNPKTAEAMRQMGAVEWITDFYQIDAATIIAKLRAVIGSLDAERRKLDRYGEQQRRALDEQYDRFLEQLTGRHMRGSGNARAAAMKDRETVEVGS